MRSTDAPALLVAAELSTASAEVTASAVHHPHHVNLLSSGVLSAEVRTDPDVTLDAKKLERKKEDAASGSAQDAPQGSEPQIQAASDPSAVSTDETTPKKAAKDALKEKPKPKPKPPTKEEQEEMLRKELQAEFETGHFYEIINRIFKEFREVYANKKFLRE